MEAAKIHSLVHPHRGVKSCSLLSSLEGVPSSCEWRESTIQEVENLGVYLLLMSVRTS
jgi:hypothetical protein